MRVNNAYITTLQVNANSYLNGDVYLSRGGDPYGHLIGPSKAHAIVLRGDAIGVGQTAYGIERGGYTTFVEWEVSGDLGRYVILSITYCFVD
jgi:hypothetical protein